MPSSAPSSVIASYDEIACAWDSGLGFRSPQFAARLRRMVVEMLAPAAGGELALELGVGTGWMLDATAPLFGRVRAIDASAGMLGMCRRRIADCGLHNVTAEIGDATTLDGIETGCADAIYAIGLLPTIREPARVIAASARVLRPGGLLVLSAPNGNCPWYALHDRRPERGRLTAGRHLTVKELIGAARAVGLVETKVITWGAAPQRLQFGPAVMLLNAGEAFVRAIGFSRYLGVLTAGFRR